MNYNIWVNLVDMAITILIKWTALENERIFSPSGNV